MRSGIDRLGSFRRLIKRGTTDHRGQGYIYIYIIVCTIFSAYTTILTLRYNNMWLRLGLGLGCVSVVAETQSVCLGSLC